MPSQLYQTSGSVPSEFSTPGENSTHNDRRPSTLTPLTHAEGPSAGQIVEQSRKKRRKGHPEDQAPEDYKRSRKGTGGMPDGKLHRKKDPIILISLDLPAGCLRGVYGNHERRKIWLDTEMPLLKEEHGVDIHGYEVLAKTVQFRCRKRKDVAGEGGRETPVKHGSVLREDQNPVVTKETAELEPLISVKKYEPPRPKHSKTKRALDTLLSPSVAFSIGRASPLGTGPISKPILWDALKYAHLGHDQWSGFISGNLVVGETTSGAASSATVNTPLPKDDPNTFELPFPKLGERKPTPMNLSTPVDLLSSAEPPSGRYRLEGNAGSTSTYSQDKSRRILHRHDSANVVTVSMRGFLHELDVKSRHRRMDYTPEIPSKEAVDDACVVETESHTYTVLAHFREESQITLVDSFSKQTTSLVRPSKRGGASALSSLAPSMFASGGHDHVVHLWTIADDAATSTCVPLGIRHTSAVQSLLSLRDSSQKILSAGADCSVHVWDVSSERSVNSLKTSNAVYHLHKTLEPHCVLMEVAHREIQFEVRDFRTTPQTPVQRFGYDTSQLHGRFIKGDVHDNLFACGDRNGGVRIWDTRQLSQPCSQVSCFPGQKIVHVSVHKNRVLALCENNQVAFLRDAGGSILS